MSVGKLDAGTFRFSHDALKLVLAHLVATAARTGVHHHRYLTFAQPERLCRRGVEDFLDNLQFQKVVAAAERPYLLAAAFACEVGYLLRLSYVKRPPFLEHLDVALPEIALLGGPLRATLEDGVQFAVRERQGAFRAQTGRNALEKFVNQLLLPRLDVTYLKIGAQQPHTAVDVEADPAWRNYAALVGVEGGDAPDGEAVAPVDVRHRQARVNDSRQRRDIGDLL